MRVCKNCFRCYDDEVERCLEAEHLELTFVRQGHCELIAGYRIEQLLEQSSSCSLFRARQIEFGHSCLIRLISANEDVRTSFLNDARSIVTFFNPSVADIYEAGVADDGDLFVVSEDSLEQSLRDLLNNVGVPQLLTSVQIIRQTAEAVHSLHQAGIVHRAIKPENILLTTDAEHRLAVKIQNPDLGGVIEKSIVANKFTIDSSIDKIRYFAPELFSNASPSPQTDIYSLGIVFYELLTGMPPFDAATASGLIEQHRHHKPADVNINSFDLRMLITHTLMSSLHKQPEQRQTSANAFARQLRHVEQLATHSPTPPPAVHDELAQPVSVAALATTPIRKIQVPTSIDIDHIPLAQSARPQVIAPSPENAPAVAIVENALPTLPHPLSVADHVPGNHEKRSENQPAVDQTFLRQRVGNPLPVNKPSADSLPPPSKLRSRRKRVHHQNAIAVKTESAEKTQGIRDTGTGKPAMIAAVSGPARKIEWNQPDDDLPSFEDVQSINFAEKLSVDPIGVSNSFAETASPRNIECSKVELSELDDDIPSLADVEAALIQERPSAVVAMKPEAAVVLRSMPTSNKEPRKIAIADFDDDLPTLEDVAAVLMTDEVAASSAVAEDALNQHISRDKPAQLGWLHFEANEIVSSPDVQAYQQKTNNEAAFAPAIQATAIAVPVECAKARPKIVELQDSEIVAPTDDDREEITVVSPRSNVIRIDLESVRPQVRPWNNELSNGRLQREVEFVPTIIGTSRFAMARSVSPSAPLTISRPSFLTEPFIYRSTMVAGGIAIFVLVSLIASFVVTDSVMSSQVGHTEAAETLVKDKPVIQFTQPRVEVPVVRETAVNAEVKTEAIVEKTAETDSKKESEKTDKSTTIKPAIKDQPKAAENTVKSKPQPPPIVKAPVISNNSKAKLSVEAQRQSATKNSGFATRPRIVVSP